MDVLTAIKSRRSIRLFKPDPLPDEVIGELLEAARLAPSGTNLQPWRFVVVKSKEAMEALAGCTPLPFVAQAPVVIACCVDTRALEDRGLRLRELQEAGAFAGTPLEGVDAGAYAAARPARDETAAMAYLYLNLAIAVEHMVLRATELGLGTCWVMLFSRRRAEEALGLEEPYRAVALLPVGYPAQQPGPRPRLPLDTILLKQV